MVLGLLSGRKAPKVQKKVAGNEAQSRHGGFSPIGDPTAVERIEWGPLDLRHKDASWRRAGKPTVEKLQSRVASY